MADDMKKECSKKQVSSSRSRIPDSQQTFGKSLIKTGSLKVWGNSIDPDSNPGGSAFPSSYLLLQSLNEIISDARGKKNQFHSCALVATDFS